MTKKICVTVLALAAAAMVAAAQEQTQEQTKERRKEVTIEHSGSHITVMRSAGTEAVPAVPATFAFISAAGAEHGPTVKNAPYTAETATETTRTLADGTRIQSKHTASLARDKDGRTRRENSFSNIGPWANSNHEAPKFVTISDPVAKEMYILNLTDRTAVKNKIGEPMVFRHETRSDDRKTVTEQRVQVAVSGTAVAGATADVTLAMPMHTTGAVARRVPFDSNNMKTESLGRQTMEGVPVDGTRITHTIPAGVIGNDRPLVTVTEKWYSPDLQMTIFTKTTDPQVGESIYRVTNLRRSEPDPSLFRVPGDFKVTEGPKAAQRFWVEKDKE
jgi:hypothetical protein